MLNPYQLVEDMAARLRTIPEIIGVFQDSSKIVAYHHRFATHTQWVRVLTSQNDWMVIRWAGTSPGPSMAGPKRYVHRFEVAIRVGEQAETEEIPAVYRIWAGFVNGIPGSAGGCCDRNSVTPLNDNVLPMNAPRMLPITDQNGQDYWLISFEIPEKGDAC